MVQSNKFSLKRPWLVHKDCQGQSPLRRKDKELQGSEVIAMDRDIERRLDKVEDRLLFAQDRKLIMDYTPEEQELLREIARRMAERIRRDHVELKDEATWKKILGKIVAELQSEKVTKND
jgi:hypothetical protein